MTKMQELARLGQSIWYDYIRRSFITSGDLKFLIEEGLRGITSNPAIFEKAIAGSADYDADIRRLVDARKTVEEIYEALALQDIGMAADLLRDVYDQTDGRDGFVSIEVNPRLAYDTGETIAEARRIFQTLARPNVMIKVPGTPEGLPAITELIASGVNVNVTLIFGLENYQQIAGAYLEGLERLAKNGPTVPGGLPVSKIGSVASFFVSRVDTAVDRELEKMGNTDLRGKIAVANSKIVYQEYQNIFSGPRWEALARQGAAKQRVLWASTSTKNPHYSPIMYVQELIGPETVNTVPPATWEAFRRDGEVRTTITDGVEEARRQLARLKELGIDLEAITADLQKAGVELFVQAFESLLESISGKREKLLAGQKSVVEHLGGYRDSVERALKELRDQRVVRRIWEHDHTVWKPEPDEISNRLNWLHLPEKMADAVAEIRHLAGELRAEGFKKALLLGMGGSSLAPEVFRETFGVAEGFLDLAVLDSTDPGAVLEYAHRFDPRDTLYIVSTKSGGTVETLSFMKYFYGQALKVLGAEQAARHFIAITDPDSKLEPLARELKFRRIFLNDPDIGGRYSALSYFGLVPAGLIGMDLGGLLEEAAAMACNCEGCVRPGANENSCAYLGAVMGELARQGRDKLTVVISPPLQRFGLWLEQLIAESTGKEGKGILPVVGEPVLAPEFYADDRLFVYLRLSQDATHDAGIQALADAGHPVLQINLETPTDLGGEIFRWEMATAIAGWRLGINPFDQPNVESAKIRAREMVEAYMREGKLPVEKAALTTDEFELFADGTAGSIPEALSAFLAGAWQGGKGKPRSYIALQAFVKPEPATDQALQELRVRLQKKYRMAVTVGYGPRFLHSTGQLHKGDAGNGLFIQFSAQMPEDAPIPDEPGSEKSSITFGVLKTAQMLGDRQALKDAGRRVMALHFKGAPVVGLRKMESWIK